MIKDFKVHDYLAALLFHIASAGPTCTDGEAAGGQSHNLAATTFDAKAMWEHITAVTQLQGVCLGKLGLAMLKAWAADTGATNEQHLGLRSHEEDVGQLRGVVSLLALMLAAEKQHEVDEA